MAERWGEEGGRMPRRNGKSEMYPLWQTWIDSSGKRQSQPAGEDVCESDAPSESTEASQYICSSSLQ